MARWSLRTKLVAVTALALVPVLVLSGWRAYSDARDVRARRTDARVAGSASMSSASSKRSSSSLAAYAPMVSPPAMRHSSS